MGKAISIIIVTYNSEADIFDCLDSIYKYNDIGEQLEVIVVDNNSSHADEMFEQIHKKYNETVLCYKNNKNGGYGQGNNVGVGLSHSPHIMIMNPDVRLLMPVFRTVLDYFQRDNIAMVGMVQMISADKRGTSFAVQTHRNSFRRYFQGIICNKTLHYFYRTMYLAGACFFVKKEIFNEIGQFDESIFLYGEENDLHYRLRKLKPKMKVLFDKELKYLHLIDMRPFSEKALWRRCESNMYIFRKNGISDISYLRKERNRLIITNWMKVLCGRLKNLFVVSPELMCLRKKIKEYERREVK